MSNKLIQSVSFAQLSIQLNNLLSDIEDQNGEINDDLLRQLNGLEQTILDKTDAIADYRRMLSDRSKNLKDRASELIESHKRTERKIENLDKYILHCMSSFKTDCVEGKYSKISTRKPAKKVFIYDETKLPPNFIRTTTSHTIDKSSLLKTLKQGEVIEGAKLVDGKQSLNVRYS